MTAVTSRVVQEAITNALEPGGGSAAEVCVRYGLDDVELEVRDQGPGHRRSSRRRDDHAVAGGGRGLVGMGERVRARIPLGTQEERS